MPDPVQYLIAFASAAGASTIVVLAFVHLTVTRLSLPLIGQDERQSLARIPAAGTGILIGCRVLDSAWHWSLSSALDRFLFLILPITVAVELVASQPRIPVTLAWLSRILLAFSCGRILLHGSVYLDGSAEAWAPSDTRWILIGTGLLLIIVWRLLSHISRHTVAWLVPLCLIQSLACAGIVIMLAGYIKGGAVAVPVCGALLAATFAGFRRSMGSPAEPSSAKPHSITGTGIVCLFCLLYIGRFFGAISTTQGILIFLNPLLCVVLLVPPLRRASPSVAGLVLLTLASIPLLILAAIAWHTFQHKMGPLL